jgi:hypothetical protein
MASSYPYYRALPNRHVGKGDRLGWQIKKKEKGREGWVKSNVTGRSGAYERCNTGQLYALVRRQAAARRQDPTVTAMRRGSQLGVKELESKLPADCSEAVGLYFFICTSHEVVMCDKSTLSLTYVLSLRLGTEKPAACIARAIIAAYSLDTPYI